MQITIVKIHCLYPTSESLGMNGGCIKGRAISGVRIVEFWSKKHPTVKNIVKIAGKIPKISKTKFTILII